jgi:hypothetical protein|tara:strand:- start:270 stop:1181 length:912 start_codon:yes stop_codon:yes gene_type:complete
VLVKVCLAFDMEARVEESAAGLLHLRGYLLYDSPSFPLRHLATKTGLAFLHHMHGDCNVNSRIAPAPIPVKTIPLDYDACGFVAGPGKLGDYPEAQYGLKACSEIVQQSTATRFYAPVMRLDEGRYCPPCIEAPSKAESLQILPVLADHRSFRCSQPASRVRLYPDPIDPRLMTGVCSLKLTVVIGRTTIFVRLQFDVLLLQRPVGCFPAPFYDSFFLRCEHPGFGVIRGTSIRSRTEVIADPAQLSWGRRVSRYRIIGENSEEAFPSNENGFSFAVEPTTHFGGILTHGVQEQVGVEKVAAM